MTMLRVPPSLSRAAVAAVLLAGLAAGQALAAVPPYDSTKVYPTEAAFLSSIKVYQDALIANPNDADAAYWLGYAYFETWGLYRGGEIPYGEDYLDKSIAALERTVRIDDRYLAAWEILMGAYYTRDHGAAYIGTWKGSDNEKSWAAAYRVLALSHDPAATNRGVPPNAARGGEVAITYTRLPDRTVRFNPATYLVIGDPDTKLLYRFSCAPFPAIKRPALFLTKQEAFARGYTPATVCPPP